MTEQRDNIDTIDLMEVIGLLIRRLWLIALSALLFGAAAFGYTFFLIEPEYQASTLLYVNNSDISVGSTSFSITASDLNAAQRLVSTYVVILKSRTVLNEVIEKADVDYTYTQLNNMITAGAVNSTEVLRIVVTCTSPTDAERIANTIADVLPERIPEIVNGSDVRIVDYAVIPSVRSSPSYTKNTAIGIVIGVLVSVIGVLLTYLLDENIHSEDYLTQNYPDIPLLAVIPDMGSTKQSGRYGYRYGYRQNSYYARRSSQSVANGDTKTTKKER